MINVQKIFRMALLQKQFWTAASIGFNVTIQNVLITSYIFCMPAHMLKKALC